MRIVVEDRRYNLGTRHYSKDIDIDYPSIPDDIPLTSNAIWNYKHNNNGIYANFRGLSTSDIESILSALKRQEVVVGVERFGNCAYYKILPQARIVHDVSQAVIEDME